MPKFRSKFQTLLSLLFLILFLNSCDRGCVESYQFDAENRSVDSSPIKDGIFGSHYDNASGGEIASWHSTGIATDGTQMVFEIRGAWTAWDDANTEAELAALQECKICAKKLGVDNCICASGQNPVPELDSLGNPLAVNCSDPAMQEDPSKCSCTKSHGNVSDVSTYFIATNYQNKDESLKLPDDQETCKYTRGLGLYVGLFGKDGNTMPIRVYQMYPTQEVCDINRNSQGKCIDTAGNDQTKYIYKSPNGMPFVKDDKSGNNGSDTNPSDDEYHQAGEFVKFIINDRYYHDNYGGYDVNFMSGFLRQDDSGLLEYLVATVEDSILGKVSANGLKRSGGALEFMYNSIVRDSVFISILQVCLIMYITLFGISVLSGTLQISKKEIMVRITQIGLIIFFTTESSWYFYNQIVVGFFKNGMDAVISIFMTASDKTVDSSSLIFTSQLDRANSLSYATRFSYADIVIKKLLSASTAKKALSLVFGEWFGIPYVMAIYALIFAFVYIMLTAAFAYIRILLGLIFVLCLGPIFMVTLLFGATKPIFKRWLSYMASQSIQIICLFLVVYLFIILIDKDFTELLSYRACTLNINFGLFNINFLKSEANRDLFTWLAIFVKIGALLFLLKMIMEKIPGFAGHMVSVGGQAADTSPNFLTDANKSAFGLAGDLLDEATKAAKSAWNQKSDVISAGKTIAGVIGRETGISSAISATRKAIPFRGPARRWEDYNIDNLINEQKGKAGKDDAKIRQGVIAEARKAGMSDGAVLKRLEQKLVIEPLEKAAIDAIKEIKKDKGSEVPLDREAMRNAVKAKITEWAKTNSSLDPSKFTDLLEKDSFKALVRKEGALTSSEAAKAFAGNSEAKNKYLQHLQNEQVTRSLKDQKADKSWGSSSLNKVKNFARGLQRNTAYNPKMARENFLAKVGYEEQERQRKSQGLIDDLKSGIAKSYNQSIINRLANKDKFSQEAEVVERETLKQIFKDDSRAKNLESVNKENEERVKNARDQYEKDLALVSAQTADQNLEDAKARSESQLQQDLKAVEEKNIALGEAAQELINNEKPVDKEEEKIATQKMINSSVLKSKLLLYKMEVAALQSQIDALKKKDDSADNAKLAELENEMKKSESKLEEAGQALDKNEAE